MRSRVRSAAARARPRRPGRRLRQARRAPRRSRCARAARGRRRARRVGSGRTARRSGGRARARPTATASVASVPTTGSRRRRRKARSQPARAAAGGGRRQRQRRVRPAAPGCEREHRHLRQRAPPPRPRPTGTPACRTPTRRGRRPGRAREASCCTAPVGSTPASRATSARNAVPERERVPGVQPAVAELVDRAQREVPEVVELPDAREVEEVVPTGQVAHQKPERDAEAHTRGDRRRAPHAGTGTVGVCPCSAAAGARRRAPRPRSRRAGSTRARATECTANITAVARNSAPRLHASAAEKPGTRSAAAIRKPGTSRHAVAAPRRRPSPVPVSGSSRAMARAGQREQREV